MASPILAELSGPNDLLTIVSNWLVPYGANWQRSVPYSDWDEGLIYPVHAWFETWTKTGCWIDPIYHSRRVFQSHHIFREAHGIEDTNEGEEVGGIDSPFQKTVQNGLMLVQKLVQLAKRQIFIWKTAHSVLSPVMYPCMGIGHSLIQ